jgi:SAM-dependent methyltransferase
MQGPISSQDSSVHDKVNRSVYFSPGVEQFYDSVSTLDPPEITALLKYQSALAGRDVLDIGVGTGRTTLYLSMVAKTYLGVDYSPVMINHVTRKFPDVKFRLGDMRDLSFLAPESMDFILASCNVVDAVSHEDRLIVLREVHRVLRCDGIFLFSTHNRNYHSALAGPQLLISLNPYKQALHLLRFIRQRVNHSRTGRLRHIESDYAVLNDPGHDYKLLHYYVERAKQVKQLTQCGFVTLDVFASSGRCLGDSEVDSVSTSLHYVAKRL